MDINTPSREVLELRHSRAERKLKRSLKRTNTLDLLAAIWSLDSVQSHGKQTQEYIKNLPPECFTKNWFDSLHINQWRLEQTINCALVCNSAAHRTQLNFQDCTNWNNLSKIFHQILYRNDTYSEIPLKDHDIFVTLGRIGHHQFPSQISYKGINSIFRSAYLHCGQKTSEHFHDTLNLTSKAYISNIMLLYAQFTSNFLLKLPCDLSSIKVNKNDYKITLKQISLPIKELRELAKEERKNDPFGEHSKSALHRHPIIQINKDTYVCPIPSLLMRRIVEGLAYDTVNADGGVRNEISTNFERYIMEFSEQIFPQFEVISEQTYGSKKRQRKTPDVRFKQGGITRVIIECKATRIEFSSKFELSHKDEMPKKSTEIIKGIVQIWRYHDDASQQKIENEKLCKAPFGVVLTLDTWILINIDRFNIFLEKAKELADEKNIPESSRIPISIMSTHEFELIARQADEDTFIECLQQSHAESFNGWMVSSVFKKYFSHRKIVKAYSIENRISEYITWWDLSN